MTTTTTILCPLCEQVAVSAPSWDFSQTTVEVPACDRHNGIVSVEIKVSAINRLAALTPIVRAAGGLVSMEVK